MDISVLINQMMVMLSLLLLGLLGAKAGAMDEETTRSLNRYAMIFPQSAMLLSSALNMETGIPLSQILGILLAGCIMYALLIAFGFMVTHFFRVDHQLRRLYAYMVMFGNSGFMGLPILNALYGDQGVLYGALLNVPFSLVNFTLGASMLSGGEKTTFNWRQILSAPMVASFVAVLLVCVHIPVPDPLVQAVDLLGDAIVPLSMMIIGASLGSSTLKETFGDWHPYAFAPLKLIAAPVFLWAVMRPLIHDKLLFQVMIVQTAMPVASTATMFSMRYNCYPKVASRTVFVSTVLSVVTIPIVCWLLLG